MSVGHGPPLPKNAGTLVAFIYATTRADGTVDLEVGWSAMPREHKTKLIVAMKKQLDKETGN